MKTLNLLFCICFAIISLMAVVFSVVQTRIDLFGVAVITGMLSYIVYLEYKTPEI